MWVFFLLYIGSLRYVRIKYWLTKIQIPLKFVCAIGCEFFKRVASLDDNFRAKHLLVPGVNHCHEIPHPGVQIPLVSLNDDGKVISASEELKGKAAVEPVNKENRKLTIAIIPFSLTCILHGKYILADPTSEEESVMDTHVTVVLDSEGRLVSLYKAGGAVLLHASVVKDCIELAKQRVEELSEILRESLSAMEVD